MRKSETVLIAERKKTKKSEKDLLVYDQCSVNGLNRIYGTRQSVPKRRKVVK